MREREVEQHRVGADGEVADQTALVGHLVVVAVRDHAGLRRPRRAGGVDEREEIVLLDRRCGLFHGTGALCGVRAPSGAKVVQIRERQYVLEFDSANLRALLVVLAENADRLRVAEDVRRVLRRAVHVDGRTDGADEAEREVEERPFEPCRGQDRERVAPADAEGQQAVGQLVHCSGGLVPGDLAPLLTLLDEVRRARPAARDPIQPEACDRASALCGTRLLGERRAFGCHLVRSLVLGLCWIVGPPRSRKSTAARRMGPVPH